MILQIDPYIGVNIILAIGTSIAYSTAPVFWMSVSISDQRSGIQRLLFGGKGRQILTTTLIILSTIVISFLVFPSSTLEAVAIGAILMVLCPAIQVSIFMTFRIGPLSFAYRDKQIAWNLEKAYDEGHLTDEYLKASLDCIVTEAKNGNTKSYGVLEQLSSRSDVIGDAVRQSLMGLKAS